MQRTVSSLFLVLIAGSAFASSKVTLGFPDGSDKLIFDSATWPTQDPSQALTVKTTKVDYTVQSSDKADRVFVVDTQSGRVASKAVSEIQNGTWNVTKEEFTAIYKLRVEVTAPKGPIAAASVEIADATGKRTQLIDPSSNGVALFMFVKPGEVKVAVTYKANGKDQDPVKQTFTVGGDKDPTLKVALPGGDANPSSAAATNAPSGSTSKSKDSSSDASSDGKVDAGRNPAGNLLMTLISFAIVGGIGYYIYLFMKKNPDKVKDTMTKLGADIPKPYDPNDDPAKDPNPIAPIKPQPMQQIILDQSSAPATPVGSPVAVISQPTPAAAVTGIPKLIASDGSAFDLPEGETVVGREFGNGLVIPNDTISRKHASLLKMGTSVEVQDHGSTNGTWVNGTKVSRSQSLRPGDSVRFGSIEYRFEG